MQYRAFFEGSELEFITEPKDSTSNYWLNAVILKDRETRDAFLSYTNNNGIMTRSVWRLMNKIEMFKDAQCGDLSNAEWLEDRIVNISSSVVL